MRPLAPLALAALMGTAVPAAAEELQERWTGALTIYGWLPAISGDTTASRGGRTAVFSYDADQVISNLDFAAFASLEVRRGRFGLMFDAIHAAFSNERNIPGNLGLRASGDLSMTIVTAAAAWRVYESGGFFVDAMGGGRMYSAEVSAAASWVHPRPNGFSESVPAVWADPLVGLRVGINLTDRLALKAYGDVGGFGVGSDFAWEAYGGVIYAFTPTIRGEFGYRAMAFDYEASRAKVDVVMQGLALGVTFGF